MGKTETSSFGTGKRESHDASAFYNRNLFDGIFVEPASAKELRGIEITPPGDWADDIYRQSSEDMSQIPNNSVALAFTSPPYNVGKDYDEDMDLEEYLELIKRVAREVYRVLVPGGRYVINIANLGRKPYIPLHAFFYDVHTKVGFLPMGEIIWQKARGVSGSCAWGSWLSAKAPRLRDIHEYLLVFAKLSFARPDKGESDIKRNEFLEATVSVWEIPPESARRVGHPAPFPVELAERVIKLYSYVGDVILDPFVGSGSTCVAAARSNRHYVGFDISEEYCDQARTWIAQGKPRREIKLLTKTECTELSVAFGTLGVDEFLGLAQDEIEDYFKGTLSLEKYTRFVNNFPKHEKLCRRMHRVGKNLRASYPLFDDVRQLQWTGPQKQASTTLAAKDLMVANIPVSIKAKSDLVWNTSPFNLFQSIPQGTPLAQGSDNWYLEQDAAGFQDLYTFVRDFGLDYLPQDVAEFEQVASHKDRRALQRVIKQFSGETKDEFDRLYLSMCHNVAQRSAEIFNENFSKSLQGKSRRFILEFIATRFFRMNTVEYIWGGIDRATEFAVVVPEFTKWTSEWLISNIEAVPNLKRKQSVVNFLVRYAHRESGRSNVANFRAEIRWSHGRFCGAPEAKLYKCFQWTSLDFMRTLF